MIGAALFGFGVGVAVERGQGWMVLKRATPMPPMAYFLAKVVMAVLFGDDHHYAHRDDWRGDGGVRLWVGQWAALGATLVAGAIPFCAIGLALGYFAGPNSSVAIGHSIFMPTVFASGPRLPFEVLPPVVQSIGALARHITWRNWHSRSSAPGWGTRWKHVLWLSGFTVLGLGLAWIGYRRRISDVG